MARGLRKQIGGYAIGALVPAALVAPKAFAFSAPLLDLDAQKRQAGPFPSRCIVSNLLGVLDDIVPLFGGAGANFDTCFPGDRAATPLRLMPEARTGRTEVSSVAKPIGIRALTANAEAAARSAKPAGKLPAIPRSKRPETQGPAEKDLSRSQPANMALAQDSLRAFARSAVALPFTDAQDSSELAFARQAVAGLETWGGKSIRLLGDEQLDDVRPLFGKATAVAKGARPNSPGASAAVALTQAPTVEDTPASGPSPPRPTAQQPSVPEAGSPAVASPAPAAAPVQIPQTASAVPESPAAAAASQPAPPPQNINPFGRDVTLDVQVRNENGAALGTLPLSISKGGALSVPVDDLLELVGDEASQKIVSEVRSRANASNKLSLDDATAAGIRLEYEPRNVALKLTMAADDSRLSKLGIGYGGTEDLGKHLPAAGLSAYATFRTALDYVQKGRETGIRKPIIDGTFAMRALGFVLESEHTADFNREGSAFTRYGSRLVYDVPEWRTRFALGDDDVLPVSFQQGTQFLGFSMTKLYRNFEPQRNIRPTTLDTFTLSRRSDVEVIVNGMPVRRLALAPGRYSLSDFPFVSGTNDVRIVASDPTGQTEVARFSRFFDFNLLAPGLSEFAAFGGIVSEPGLNGPVYLDDEYFASGFYRRGLSNVLTVGGNAQFDRNTRQVGAEMLLATSLGIVGVNVAGSHFRGEGAGAAGRVELQRINDNAGPGKLRSVRIAAEAYSRKFSSAGQRHFTVYPTAWRLTADATMRVRGNTFVTGDVGYSRARIGFNEFYVGAQIGFSIGETLNVSLGTRYETGNPRREGFSGFATLTKRIGRKSYLTASGETRDRRAQVAYRHVGSGYVGSVSANLQLDYLDKDGSVNGNIEYIANRAELGLAHIVNYSDAAREISDSRTTARASFSLAMADGGFTFGRPIRDAFAIVGRHSSLRGKTVYADPRMDGFETTGYEAKSDAFGPALLSEMNSYTARSVEVEVPDAPAGYDLGSGAFLLKPPYRAGYRLTVGSAYSVLVTGTLLDDGKKPVVLAVGKARSLDDPDAPARDVFTNSSGRFSASGLSPGRWRITIDADPPLNFVVTVPEGNEGLLRVGVLEPQ